MYKAGYMEWRHKLYFYPVINTETGEEVYATTIEQDAKNMANDLNLREANQ